MDEWVSEEKIHRESLNAESSTVVEEEVSSMPHTYRQLHRPPEKVPEEILE